MNTFTKIGGLAVLALMSVGARAETVCNNCEYVYFGSYLGGFWPGDRATFGNRRLVADLTAQLGPGMGQNRQFDNYWVFDLNANAGGVLTVGTRALTALDPLWSVEIYEDGGSTCDALRCSVVFSFDDLRLIMNGFTS